jgi:hypothetical protein
MVPRSPVTAKPPASFVAEMSQETETSIRETPLTREYGSSVAVREDLFPTPSSHTRHMKGEPPALSRRALVPYCNE